MTPPAKGFQGSDRAMQELSDPNNVHAMLGDFLSKRKGDAMRLLHSHGIKTATFQTKKALRVAYLKAIKESDSFRNALSKVLAGKVAAESQAQQNFIEQPALSFIKQPAYLNEIGQISGFTVTGQTTVPGMTTTSTAPATSTTTSKPSFWSQIFTPEVIQTGIKTGLTTLSTTMQAKANSSSDSAAIRAEELRLAQIQAQQELERTKNEKKGMPAWAWIAIGVGSAAVIVTAVIFMKRGRKARAAA